MTPEERARHFDGDWPTSPSMPAGAPVPADDDARHLSLMGQGSVTALLFVAVIVAAAWFLR